MELSKQVVSLEQAKRLKELGVDKPSIFSHVYHTDREPYISLTEYLVEVVGFGKKMDSYSLPAYTVAELGVMLPERWKAYWTESYNLGSGEWRCDLYKRVGDSHSEEVLSKYGDTEAEARAAMLIHLIENGLIEMK